MRVQYVQPLAADGSQFERKHVYVCVLHCWPVPIACKACPWCERASPGLPASLPSFSLSLSFLVFFPPCQHLANSLVGTVLTASKKAARLSSKCPVTKQLEMVCLFLTQAQTGLPDIINDYRNGLPAGLYALH